MSLCPCQSGKEYEACCGPIISGSQAAPNPEAVMRSRYTAFAKGEVDYLKNSLHPDQWGEFDPAATKDLAENSEWLGFKIINSSGGGQNDQEGTVEFVVTFRMKGVSYNHHELSQFNRVDGVWYYTDGKIVTPENPQT